MLVGCRPSCNLASHSMWWCADPTGGRTVQPQPGGYKNPGFAHPLFLLSSSELTLLLFLCLEYRECLPLVHNPQAARL